MMCECNSEYTLPYRPIIGWECKKCGEIVIENPLQSLEQYADTVIINNREKGKEIKSILLKLRKLIG